MTYKDIRKVIESYENKCNEAYMVYGDHDQTKEKWQIYLSAKNKKDAALAALYEISRYYRYAKEDEELKLGLMNHLDAMDEEAESTKDKAKQKEKQDFNKVYRFILEEALDLDEKEFLKLMKYGEQKINEHIKKDEKIRNKENTKVVNELVRKVSNNYDKFISDRRSRQQDYFHVGTTKEEMNAHYNLITKEEVMYFLLYNAIEDAIRFENENILLSKELIESAFDRFTLKDKDKSNFYDEDSYELSKNGYKIYKDTFERVYDLSKESKKKLVKRLNNKLKEQ